MQANLKIHVTLGTHSTHEVMTILQLSLEVTQAKYLALFFKY